MGEAWKWTKQVQGKMGLERREEREVDPDGRRGSGRSRKAVTESGHLTGCPAIPDLPLSRALAASPLPSMMMRVP